MATEGSQSNPVSMEEIGEAECLELLAGASVGRIGLVVDGRPEVLPVNYVLDGHTIVFRTAEGTVLHQASLQVVAFEVDHLDPTSRTGWSVLAQGVARDVTGAIDASSERLRALALITWAPGARHCWFRINADKISGRRLHYDPEAV